MISNKLDLNHLKSILSEKEIKEKKSILNKSTLEYLFINLCVFFFAFSIFYMISKSIIDFGSKEENIFANDFVITIINYGFVTASIISVILCIIVIKRSFSGENQTKKSKNITNF